MIAQGWEVRGVASEAEESQDGRNLACVWRQGQVALPLSCTQPCSLVLAVRCENGPGLVHRHKGEHVSDHLRYPLVVLLVIMPAVARRCKLLGGVDQRVKLDLLSRDLEVGSEQAGVLAALGNPGAVGIPNRLDGAV